jgi:muramoyltetrapeptide carboxypeptidase LdcA involved in peptidoglycan recycling
MFLLLDLLTFYLRNLGAQGILNVAKGIVVGKPQAEEFYEEYKEVYRKILKEFKREDMPVLYNVNFGHSSPIGIIPYGIECELDVDNKKITLLESIVE